MAWFKVDDTLWHHEKFLDLSGDAVALWLRGGTWAAHEYTNGLVRRKALRLLLGTPEVAQELVDAGLWEEHPEGWVFHDWHDYQPSPEEVEERRAARRAAGRKGGLAKAARARAASAGLASATASATALAKQPASTTPSTDVAKVCPVPVPVPVESGPARASTSRILRPGERPPPRCPLHLEVPAAGPCGPCGDWRRFHDEWTPPTRAEVRCPEHDTLHTGTCPGCAADEKASRR